MKIKSVVVPVDQSQWTREHYRAARATPIIDAIRAATCHHPSGACQFTGQCAREGRCRQQSSQGSGQK